MKISDLYVAIGAKIDPSLANAQQRLRAFNAAMRTQARQISHEAARARQNLRVIGGGINVDEGRSRYRPGRVPPPPRGPRNRIPFRGGGGGEGGGNGVMGALGEVAGVRRLLYGAGAFAGVHEVVELADTFTNLHSRLKLLTGGSMPEAQSLFAKTRVIAQNTRSDLESTTEGFVRIAKATQSMGLSTDGALLVTERINKTLKMSGASSSEARAGMMQLTQALAKGKLDGDEFKSLGENLPAMLDVLKKHLGVTEGKLRSMSRAGQLTTKTIIKAFQEASYIDEDFKNTIPTITEQFVMFKNEMIVAFGEFARDTDLASLLKDALVVLGFAFKVIIEVLKPIFSALAAFTDGLKDGEIWAYALAAVLAANLIPQMVALAGWLIKLPRLMYVFSLYRVASVALGIEKIGTAFTGAAGAASNFAQAASGARAAATGGWMASALGMLGPLAAAAAAAYVVMETGTDTKVKDFFAGTKTTKLSDDNYTNNLKLMGLTPQTANAQQRMEANFSTPQELAAKGLVVNQTININGVKDADQAVKGFEAGTRDLYDRQMRHAAAATGR